MKQAFDPKNKDLLININGELYHRDVAGISPFDSAVQGGDAVWEGLRLYQGRIFKLIPHLDRLRHSALAMAFSEIPTHEAIIAQIGKTLAANQMTDGVHIRLTLSRGLKYTSGMDTRLNTSGPTLIVLAEHKPPVYDKSGIRLITSSIRRIPPDCVDQNIHSCNLINSILAKIQANAAGVDDALMLDYQGYVAETNATHVFIVQDGVVMTPDTGSCPEGITRAAVLEICAGSGIPCQVKNISLTEVYRAEEMFCTGTMGELAPVVELDGRPIGRGGAGDMTLRLSGLFRECTRSGGLSSGGFRVRRLNFSGCALVPKEKPSMSDLSFVGKPTPMLDGPAKVTGNLKYTGDLKLAGMLHARFVLSTYAHAAISDIDAEAALAIPGVHSVLTAADLPEIIPSSRAKLMLARDRVIFVGQPVAMVLADTAAAAADGAELVVVDYEPLEAVTSMDAAVAEGAPVIWPKGIPTGAEDEAAHGADTGGESEEDEGEASNIAGRTHTETGDVNVAFAQSDVVVQRTFETPMVHQSSIETQGWVVQPNPLTGGVTMWGSVQSPFGARMDVADALGVPESDVTVYGMPVGGAFGAKFGLYEALIALVAVTVGRPVSLILTRGEELLSTNPAPALRIEAKLGFKSDGGAAGHAIHRHCRHRRLSQRLGWLRGYAIRQLLSL